MIHLDKIKSLKSPVQTVKVQLNNPDSCCKSERCFLLKYTASPKLPKINRKINVLLYCFKCSCQMMQVNIKILLPPSGNYNSRRAGLHSGKMFQAHYIQDVTRKIPNYSSATSNFIDLEKLTSISFVSDRQEQAS